MFKSLVFKLAEIYVINEAAKKKQCISYLTYFFIICALVVLIFTDYVYLSHEITFVPYIGTLLTSGIVLLFIAIIFKLFSVWMIKRILDKTLTNIHTVHCFLDQALPIFTKLIPAGITAYLISRRIRSGFFKKNK